MGVGGSSLPSISVLPASQDHAPMFNAAWVFPGAFPGAVLLVHLPALPPKGSSPLLFGFLELQPTRQLSQN